MDTFLHVFRNTCLSHWPTSFAPHMYTILLEIIHQQHQFEIATYLICISYVHISPQGYWLVTPVWDIEPYRLSPTGTYFSLSLSTNDTCKAVWCTHLSLLSREWRLLSLKLAKNNTCLKQPPISLVSDMDIFPPKPVYSWHLWGCLMHSPVSLIWGMDTLLRQLAKNDTCLKHSPVSFVSDMDTLLPEVIHQ